MGKQEDPKTVTRRDVLKLAGTAAAFCTSFGFLHAADGSGQISDKNHKIEGQAFLKWEQAELRWYAGQTLFHKLPIPAKVAKHLASNASAVVELKLFRAGELLRNLAEIQGKH